MNLRKPAKIFLLSFLALLLVNSLCGQTHNLRCKNIGIPEGLSNNHITDIIQDKYDYIWIATERGLNRFDGSEMINYPVSSGNGSYQFDNNIIDLENNVDGGLWIVSREGLIQYENGFFRQKRLDENTKAVHDAEGNQEH